MGAPRVRLLTGRVPYKVVSKIVRSRESERYWDGKNCAILGYGGNRTRTEADLETSVNNPPEKIKPGNGNQKHKKVHGKASEEPEKPRCQKGEFKLGEKNRVRNGPRTSIFHIAGARVRGHYSWDGKGCERRE